MRSPSAPTTLLLALCSACAADEPDACFPYGRDANAPRSAGVHEQGTALQGVQVQGVQVQGVQVQGVQTQGIKDQGQALALSELAGVRLELADDGEAVTLHDGRLVAGGLELTEASRDVALVATTRAAERIPIAIASIADVGGSQRIALVSNGWTVCTPGKDGMFVAGSWDETGAFRAERDRFTYACMDGVIAKCVDWGYAPWSVGSELHATCTRLARADYCGDGRSWTLDGTSIDVYDALGVQSPVHDPDFDFEAAWGAGGAVCVNATRYDIRDASGRSVEPQCVATLPQCASLAEATALGAVIANDSAHAPIDVCG
jgi:hypothetical protein